MQFISLEDTDILIVCIYYGIIAGTGMGLVLKQGFSQGSSDTLAKIDNSAVINIVPLISTWGKGLGFDTLEIG